MTKSEGCAVDAATACGIAASTFGTSATGFACVTEAAPTRPATMVTNGIKPTLHCDRLPLHWLRGYNHC